MNSITVTNTKLSGGLLIIFSGYWIYRNIEILYSYKYLDILYIFMIPRWILVLQAIIGFIGVLIGYLIINENLKIVIGYLIFFIIWLCGIGIETVKLTI